jgi:pimeloyl-ACP methyl ester carboxylesterase
MERATVNGVELEYEVQGDGEPVILFHGGLLADENTTLVKEPALTQSYRVINYHRRGFAGSEHPEGQAQISDQVADARALLAELGIDRVHVVGHSLGGVIGIQLALDQPEMVHSLALLEPALMGAIAKSQAGPEAAAKSQQDFREGMKKVNEIFETGDRRGALMAFLETRAGGAFREVLDWLTETGEFDQAVRDADTFLQVEMPAAYAWSFTPEDAKRIQQPVLSVLGVQSPERAQKVHQIVKQWIPQTQEVYLENAEHALPLMDPPGIAKTLAEWLSKHPMEVRA